MKLGKPENLMNVHSKAIANSVAANKAKAQANTNNMRAVALLRSLVNEGKSLSEMASLLNEQGFVTSKGGKFHITQVRRLLQRCEL